MESVDAVNKILEEANKRIQATGTGTSLSFFCCFLALCSLYSPFHQPLPH